MERKYNRTNRVRNAVEAALISLDKPCAWPEINDWCYSNIRRWYKHAPTPNQIGSILTTDHRIVKVGSTRRHCTNRRSASYTLWALKEWDC